MKKTWLELYPDMLEKQFSNIRRGSNPFCDNHYVVDAPKGDVGQISYLGKGEWRVYVDNFPGQKKTYSTNFPINSKRDFIREIARVGLDLVPIK